MSAVGRVDVGPEKPRSSTRITLKQIRVRAGIKVRVPEQPQESRAPGQSYKGSGRDGNVGAQRSPSSSGDQAIAGELELGGCQRQDRVATGVLEKIEYERLRRSY